HVASSSFGNYVDQIGFYPAGGSAGWVFKVDGASPPGRRRPGPAEGRRRRPLVLGDLRRQRRPADADPDQGAGPLLSRHEAGRRGQDLRRRRRSPARRRAHRPHAGRHRVRHGAPHRAPRVRLGHPGRGGALEPAAVIRRALLCAAAAATLAGCGGGGAHGHATLWITRDEGTKVLLVRSVPAHETALQALERSATISTRYGGRFVQSIDGLSGSISARHDWFYFVNGIEADRSAAAYRLRDGAVTFVFAGDPSRLLDPSFYRHRYRVP